MGQKLEVTKQELEVTKQELGEILEREEPGPRRREVERPVSRG